jgi:hypothetical protein
VKRQPTRGTCITTAAVLGFILLHALGLVWLGLLATVLLAHALGYVGEVPHVG